MRIKAEKQHIVSLAIALVLAAVIILCSVFTVAAAVQTENGPAQNSSNSKKNTSNIEYELSNGDMLVTRNDNLEISVDVLKGNEVKINNGKTTKTVMIAKGTVADALEKAGITVGEKQVAVPSEKTDIISDTEINIYNAKKITVTADGETKEVLVPEGNVVESLNMAGYNIDGDDILDISRDSDVWDSMSVVIKRVTFGEETSKEKIAYDTVNENSDKIELGTTKIKTKGKNGEKLVTRKCKYIDGKKVSEKTISDKTIKKPVDEVTLVGTKGAASSSGAGTFTDLYGNSVAYSQVLTGSGTAYTAPDGAGTATGVAAYHGGVAVNPNIIPYGSKLYIVSTDGSFVYGYATAVDTGGALMDGSAIVDCFYNTYDECVNFGRRDVNVYVIG